MQESSPVSSLYGEDSSPNMDESVDPYADTEVEGEGGNVKREVSEHQYGHMEGRHEEEEEEDEEENEMKPMNKDGHQTKEQSQFRGSLSEEPGRKSLPEAMDKSCAVAINQRGYTPSQNAEKSKAVQQHRHKESQERQQRSKMLESFRFENPMLLNLCGFLFSHNKKSVWSGPHSLAQNRGSSCSYRDFHEVDYGSSRPSFVKLYLT
ncbi:uncharacterized protein LOC120145404 [Hibiscus syriacus]|uniref:uncharacterized protein LOC120145404 n=1 Tax=Hibiscus syriacus TaxID=106335 RepID=UPI0019231F0F|nr:uncharacterized protein LOC120145404 [Hibiscus syriacus]